MGFRNLILPILVSFVFSGCSEDTRKSSVFVETSKFCEGSAIPNEYIATWKDGTIETIKADSDDEIIKNFVEPNIKNLERVEHDFKIEIELPEQEISPLATDTNNWGQNQVRARAAWELGILGDNVIIAVVDSGVEVSHSYLKDNIFVTKQKLTENLALMMITTATSMTKLVGILFRAQEL